MLLFILSLHSLFIKIFLGFLVLGFLIPILTTNNPLAFKKWSFLFTISYHGFLSMIVFLGLLASIIGDLGFNIAVELMIFSWFLLTFLEIKRHKKVAKTHILEEAYKSVKNHSLKFSIFEILVVIVMVIIMILSAKGILFLG